MAIPTVAEARDISFVGYSDLAGHPAFKLSIQQVAGRWLLYTGSFWDSGWSIVDVTDPERPEYLRFVEGPPSVRTVQVQVAGGRMVTSLERNVGGADTTGYEPGVGGAYIWDVAGDPLNPTLLGHYDSGGNGTHRNFYDGGRYLYATVRGLGPLPLGGAVVQPKGWTGPPLGPEGTPEGYFSIVDLEDPTQPIEIARWPGSRDDPNARRYFHGPPYASGDRVYGSFGGMVILDVADVRKPTFISRLDFGDFGGAMGCHSAVPYPTAKLVVANTEGSEEGAKVRLKYAAVIDVSDEDDPRLLSTLPYPRAPAAALYGSYWTKGGRFGPHNQHHHQGHPDLHEPQIHAAMTWFNAGLRIYSLEDPYYPEEIAHFVPSDPERRYGSRPANGLVAHFEDIVIDKRGFIYCSDANQGLFVLRYDGELR
jgi:hypothetical protein